MSEQVDNHITTKPYPLNFTDGTEITSYLATAYAEGFCEGEGANETDQLRAWAYLIGTGQCWSLQGWFGRTANNLIENEVISKEGKILIEFNND